MAPLPPCHFPLGSLPHLFPHLPFHWKRQPETPSVSVRELTSRACGGKAAHTQMCTSSPGPQPGHGPKLGATEQAGTLASLEQARQSSVAVQGFSSGKLWMNPTEISEMFHWLPGAPCLDTKCQASKDLTW